MNRPLRICFVETQDYAFIRHRLPLGRALVASGVDLHVIAPGGSAESAIRSEGVTYHRLSMRRAGANPITELLVVQQLLRLYRELRPNLVHHFGLKSVLYGAIAGRLSAVPGIVGSITGLGYTFIPGSIHRQILRGTVTRLLRGALRDPRVFTIFQNPDDRDLFLEKGLVRSSQTRLIFGSGVDVERFAPAPEPSGPPVVLVGTRMLLDKGIVELVEASRMLRQADVQVKIRLAGAPDPGNPVSISEDQLRSWDAEGIVEWVGQKGDMAEQLRQAHIACLPSYREGLPLFLAEAAAAGRPSVTTDVPGCRTAIETEKTGLLVPPRDSRALAAALTRLIQDDRLRHAMGNRARELALAQFSSRVVTTNIFELYRSVLGHRGDCLRSAAAS